MYKDIVDAGAVIIMKGLQMDAVHGNALDMVAKAVKDWETILNAEGEFVFKAAYMWFNDCGDEGIDDIVEHDVLNFFQTRVLPGYVSAYIQARFFIRVVYINPNLVARRKTMPMITK